MSNEKRITIDGNTAAASMAYMLSDTAFIYPITPSSPMAENIDAWGVKGKKNIYGKVVEVTEMQSEAGAAGALHGALTAGSKSTTFTSSQGLLLMIPNMYKIAGEMLPCVIHVAARTIATHALSIFGDHSDVMGVRQTGFAMLASSSVQEAQDMSLAAHLATNASRIPFVHFFDGFRTSHEVNTITAIDDAVVKALAEKYGNIYERTNEFTPSNPIQKGTNQGEDIFFQNREACNKYIDAIPGIVDGVLKDIGEATGRKYGIFEYYGAKDAENVIVIMGSGADTTIQAVSALAKTGAKVGVIKVRLYRPFDVARFVKALPKTTKMITVLDRTKECGATYEPLAEDVIAALNDAGISGIRVLGGRYGLSCKEYTHNHVVAVYENMLEKKPKNHFTVGINDDVTFTSLPDCKQKIDFKDKEAVECRFYGLGSDGTVSANKNSIKIISEYAGFFGQAYFVYDSKKSGGLTTSHLRMSKKPINAPYLTQSPDFVACHNKSYVTKYDMLSQIKLGGTFLLNSPWTDEEMEKELPASMKKFIADKKLKFFTIDAEKVAEEVGLNRRINVVMQTAFFALAGVLDVKTAIAHIKDAAAKTYASKGEKVVQMNIDAIDRSLANLREVKYPASWSKATSEPAFNPITDPYYKDYIRPIELKLGDNLPVSAFDVTGSSHTATSQYEKRNIATMLPKWIKENCVQCNQCALVCPHAVIRPYLVPTDSDLAKEVGAIPAIGVPGYSFKIQISPKDCTGCENCVHSCPALNKALEMVKAEDIIDEEVKLYDKLKDVENVKTIFKKETVKGSQFEKPLFEFSGACAGCGETPYVKLLTQLFGEEMIVANATGCSSIYSGTAPTCPYTKSKTGFGPAWSNSLFEDNAEFGLGMKKAVSNNRKHLEETVKQAIESKAYNKAFTDKLATWLSQETKEQALALSIKNDIIAMYNADKSNEITRALYGYTAALFETSVWIIGGDGWAYDIGYGGLDHVLASGEDVNILVLDTEVYSNTGGQASKATPMGSVAKFAAGGKQTQKKNLGAIARQYPNVYVAQVAMGANPQATITAFKEAKENKGPSIIIAYCPCINHGGDMSHTQQQEKLAVETGYWPIYRYNPTTEKLTFDAKLPSKEYEEFTKTQARYFTLAKTNPEESSRLISGAKEHAKEVIENLAEDANKQ
ncbi:MAG: pyruvate:ferredoxin (flavodoxin) oxidoreductase [Clostridia bacterium]|nr:pyruvate:ferredoxin (flavodoxin) oxidoreductase [Clostridia bacterium]